MSKLKFTVIIVNYNSGALLQACVDSLSAQSLPPSQVLIIDNASTDGSAEQLVLSDLPQTQIIFSADNLGFSGGNNLASKQATGDWIVLLNPDARAKTDWLEKIAEGIEEFSSTEMFACAQLDAEDEASLDGAGDSYLVFGFPWRGGFGRPRSELPEVGECFSACGASLVISKSRFIELEGFDERFFCYCEDVDLGFRHRLRGGQCVFLPKAVVLHIGSAISGQRSDFTVRHGTRNRIWTYVKNMPP
ncbi:glycosyltransferase family 2 protein, partial [Cobetia sp. Dlab-2-U]|uniref:glycosyltransferase family 2 protein n=1 Tax=Cobetia sp. Dlab-2-U TaxID=2954489 RepID=UPI0020981DBD